MRKIILSSVVAIFFSCSVMGEDVAQNENGGEGLSFKNFASKTYNFLGIQTKEETSAVLSGMGTDIEALKKAANELKSGIENINKNQTSQNEKIAQDFTNVAVEQKKHNELFNQKVDVKELETLKEQLKSSQEEIQTLNSKIENLKESLEQLSKTISELPKQSTPVSN